MKKRILPLVLIVIMVMTVIPTVFAEDDFVIEDSVLTKYNGPGGAVAIPYGVTAIGSGAFDGSADLTSITIPDSVTAIRWDAFYGCIGLTSIIIPDSVKEIGDSAFYGCIGLTSIIIPDSVTEIENGAFDGCTGLVSINIPNSVAEIGEYVFSDCTNLSEIIVAPMNQYFMSDNGVLYNKEMTTLITCPGAKTFVSIPNSVTEIGVGAFYGCTALTSITIPDSVTEIGENAFDGCTSLASVTISNSLAIIQDNAFFGCVSLTSVTIPSSVTDIRWGAFYGCANLSTVKISDNVTEIEEWAFSDCLSLISVTIPSSVTGIGDFAFSGCENLTIHGETGSYAQTYALEHDIPFIQSVASASTLTAVLSPSKVFVNGIEKDFDAYLIDGSNYFKLRDLAVVLNGTSKQFEVGYDNATAEITLTPSKAYTIVGGEMALGDGKAKAATPTKSKIYANGKEVTFTVYNIGGNNYFKLRDVMKLFNVGVGWDNTTKVITLNTAVNYIDP